MLHLVVPGLLGPLPRRQDASAVPLPRFPVLERWLARAEQRPVPADPDALLFELFGRPAPADRDLPTAPLCHLADSGQLAEGVVYHADPVHLRPDQDRLLLFDIPATTIDRDQAAAFVAAFNAHFAADGWRLSAPSPCRWYLHLAELPALRTRPLGEVLGRNVDLFLPTGPDARRWRQRLTEVQMLFHGLPVNQQRWDRGLPAVNGLWLHGGSMPPRPAGGALQVDAGAPPLLQGLAATASGAPRGRLRWLGAAQRAVWDADPMAWLHAVQQLEQLLAASRDELWLYPGNGRGYRCRGAQRWRLWRSRRPLSAYLLSPELP